MSVSVVMILLISLGSGIQTLDDRSISELESYVDNQNVSTNFVRRYELMLMRRRSLSMWTPSNDRKRALGSSLREKSLAYNETDLISLNKLWRNFVEELLTHERSLSDSTMFYKYNENGWNPMVFRWSLVNFLLRDYDTIANDANASIWLPAIHAGIHYVENLVPNKLHGHNFLRLERIQHVFHFYNLYSSTGTLLSQYKQIIEYGAGTGDNAATIRELGFEGLHIVIDIPPMLFMQQYFLRYSGWPAYLGHGLQLLNGRSTILESTFHRYHGLSSHISAAEHKDTLFMATWSLTETHAQERDRIFPLLKAFGTILITFGGDDLEGLNNKIDMLKRAKEFENTHSICVWELPNHANNFYFIAQLKYKGNVACVKKIGCTNEKKIYGDCTFASD